jgi:hypothetical protein
MEILLLRSSRRVTASGRKRYKAEEMTPMIMCRRFADDLPTKGRNQRERRKR